MKQSFIFLFLFLITVIPFHANADLLNSAVRIKAQIPEKARTSKFLGKEREGSGIVIDDEGHVLTIGYLVLEAGSVEITDVDGRVIAAAVEGYDGDSGFGLLKALSPLQARPLRLSDSSDIQSEERLRVVSSQDDTVVQQVVVLERGTFAGYWEYLLENAIFTVPAVNAFAGAGLVNEKGELVGIGSLFLKRNFQSTMVPSNMFVPTEALLPILDDLKRSGRSSSPPDSKSWEHSCEKPGGFFPFRLESRKCWSQSAADPPPGERTEAARFDFCGPQPGLPDGSI